MLKSAIRRKIEKHIKNTDTITDEIKELQDRNDTVSDLSSVIDSLEKAKRAFNLANSELRSCLLRLPVAAKELIIEIKR